MPPQPEFSRPFALERLGAGREALRIEATAQECKALAARLGLVALEGLAAELSVEGNPTANLVIVRGRLQARVTETCVVTSEPFTQALEDSFEQIYSLTAGAPDEEEALADPDQPEPLPEGGLDLGEEVAQQLSLARDPYPRAPGAELPESARQGEAGPFAVLKNLAGRGSGGSETKN